MSFESLVQEYIENRFNNKKSRKYIKRMYREFMHQESDLVDAKIYFYDADCSFILNELSKAQKLATKALYLLKNFPPCHEMASAYNILGIMSVINKDSIAGLGYYLQAIDVLESIGNKERLIIINNNIGVIFSNIFDYPNAIKYYKKGLQSAAENEASARYIYLSTLNICTCYIRVKDLKNAKRYWDKMLKQKYDFTKSPYVLEHYTIYSCICALENNHETLYATVDEIVSLLDNGISSNSLDLIFGSIMVWIDYGLIDLINLVLEKCHETIIKSDLIDVLPRYYYARCILYRHINDQNRANEYAQLYLDAENVALHDQNKGIAQGVSYKLEAHQMQKNLNELSIASMSDQLTEIYNRRALDSIINGRFNYAKSVNHSVGVIIIDVDYFKQYNDHYGHIQGDACLKMIAQQMRLLANDQVEVIRYGGDEFLIVTFNLKDEEVLDIANNLRQNVIAANFVFEKSPYHLVTLSQGVYNGKAFDDENIYDFILKADKALYRSKINKNCVSL